MRSWYLDFTHRTSFIYLALPYHLAARLSLCDLYILLPYFTIHLPFALDSSVPPTSSSKCKSSWSSFLVSGLSVGYRLRQTLSKFLIDWLVKKWFLYEQLHFKFGGWTTSLSFLFLFLPFVRFFEICICSQRSIRGNWNPFCI